jgi:hypothetical protein
MVTHYEPARLRRNSDQPTAITGVQVATSASTYRTGDIPLGTPTSSARSRQGLWALYPNGAEVVVVHPGGALAGAPADVAGELGRLGGDGQDELGRSAARGIAEFLTDPDADDRPRWPARGARTWSSPAAGYQLAAPPTTRATPPTSRPAGPVHRRACHSHWSRHPAAPRSAARSPTPAQRQHHDEPPDRNRPEPRPHTSHPDGSPAPVKWGDLRLHIVAALDADPPEPGYGEPSRQAVPTPPSERGPSRDQLR